MSTTLLDKFEAQYILHLGSLIISSQSPAQRRFHYVKSIITQVEKRIHDAQEVDYHILLSLIPGAWAYEKEVNNKISSLLSSDFLDEHLKKSMGDAALASYLLMNDEERLVALRFMLYAGSKAAKLTGTPLYDDWEAEGKPDFVCTIDVAAYKSYVSLADMEI